MHVILLVAALALGQIADEPPPSHWELRSWTTYTAPAWILLAAIILSLLMMLRIIIRYRRTRRRRINRWNRPTGRHRDDSAFT